MKQWMRRFFAVLMMACLLAGGHRVGGKGAGWKRPDRIAGAREKAGCIQHGGRVDGQQIVRKGDL